MSKYLYKIILLFAVHYGFCGQAVYLYDLWTGEPVAGALIMAGGDSVISNYNGFADIIDTTGGSIVIEAENYYKEKIALTELKSNRIYLAPYDYTETINVIRPADVVSRSAIPAHISRINLEGAANILSAAELLKAQSGVVIKSYGSDGQMQMISIRGMSAGQTQTLLDGVPLNNLQLGSFDFSMVSLNSLRGMDIYRGGNYMFGGSGAIGGVINLQSITPSKNIGYELLLRMASWENNLIFGKLDLPLGGIKQLLSFEQSSGINNYCVEDNGAKVVLRNRDFTERNLQYRGETDFTDKNNLEWALSYSDKDGGAPGAYINENAERSNRARINNENVLSRVKFRHFTKSGMWSLQAFIRNGWMEYDNPTLIIDGSSLHSVHFNSEKGVQIRLNHLIKGNLLLNSGLDGTQQSINSSEAGKHFRNQFALFSLLDWLAADHFWYFNNLHLNGGMRFEKYTDLGAIFLPQFSISANLSDAALFFSAGKNYRAPAFNDLYWQPGGNVNLKPEKSVNLELGVNYEYAVNDLVFNLSSSIYRNNVTEQIKWLPKVGEIYWTPQNIASVLSQGFELRFDLQDVRRVHKVSFDYSYGSAVKNSSEFTGDNSVGNYLPFIPKEKWNIHWLSGFSIFSGGVNLSWSGFRYTSLANKEFLPSYYLLDIYAGSRFILLGQQIKLSFEVNNAFDTRYEVMKGYPMPPRNYRVSLRFTKGT